MKWFLVGLVMLVCLTVSGQEVLVLGIAQDAGHPQANCHKDCCESVHNGTRDGHMVSSLAISDGQSFWIVDATPDFPEQLRFAQETFEGQTFSGILLTHAHIGHYTGLMYLGKEAMGAKSIPVFVMPRMSDFLQNNGPWSQLVELKNIELIPINGDGAFLLGENLRITPVQVPHRDEFSETVGFGIASSEKELLYIPDIDKWNRWHRTIEDVIQSYDHLLLDGTFYDEHELPGRNMEEIPHPLIVETIDALKTLPEKDKSKVKFIHLNHTNPVLNKNAKEYQEILGVGFKVAHEGELITLY